ncbi:MAG: ubiquinol-cytochrome C chaperone family [Trebouxia sp. A1-2]|nr:MAG: ubiquinol-cytochrome C chaperone family [Trebouxia sp. A1-2]
MKILRLLVSNTDVLSCALLSSFECAAVFDLQKRFANEYNMLCLHVWMLLVRLRSEGKDGKDIAQMVYETFQDNVETRVRAEGVKVRLNKWLNELEQMFYGMSFAFDKSLTGEEVITNALLRNFYNDDQSKQKPAEILSRYVTRELACLAKTESEHVLAGKIKFSDDILSR